MNEQQEATLAWMVLNLILELEQLLWDRYYKEFLDLYENAEPLSKLDSSMENDPSE